MNKKVNVVWVIFDSAFSSFLLYYTTQTERFARKLCNLTIRDYMHTIVTFYQISSLVSHIHGTKTLALSWMHVKCLETKLATKKLFELGNFGTFLTYSFNQFIRLMVYILSYILIFDNIL